MVDWASPSPFLLGSPDEQPQDIARANSCLAIVLGSLLVGLSCPGRSPTLKRWSSSIRLCQLILVCIHSLAFAILDCLFTSGPLAHTQPAWSARCSTAPHVDHSFARTSAEPPCSWPSYIYILLSYCCHCYCLVLFLLNLATTQRARLCHSSST